MTEGYDRDIRTSREKGNLNINVSLFKILNEPLKRDFISKDLQHPNKPGIMKRQTTFKPIDHIYRWIINKNTNNNNSNNIILQINPQKSIILKKHQEIAIQKRSLKPSFCS